jgi:uncharacterized membrane protein
MERMAEAVASGMGTVQFVVIGSLIIFGWVVMNGAGHYVSTTIKALSHGGQFDPEPWILLNLIFSGVAFYTGALVIIAQKAQNKVIKANEEASAKHRQEEHDKDRELLAQNTELTEKVAQLTTEVHTLVSGSPPKQPM